MSHINEVNQDFKDRMFWWYTKLNNVQLKIWEDPWLDFMLCWMIFDAYLTEISQSGSDHGKLKYFYQNKTDFKNRLLAEWGSLSGYATKLKELSPIPDMRPNSNSEVRLDDTNDLEQTFNFVYQIRCNLFHGAKDMKNNQHEELVRRGGKFLRSTIVLLMNARKDAA